MSLISRCRLRSLRALLVAATLGSTALVTNVALAGEVVLSAQPIPTDASGNITAEGRKAAVKELPSEPGEELWILHLWAKIDKGAPGPLYVEFVGKLPDGKPYPAHSHEHSRYDGEKYINLEIELDGNRGFNKGHTYQVEVQQMSDKNKAIPLGSSSIKLVFTEGKKGEKEADEETEGPSDEQDELDSFAGGGEGGGDGPPPVEPKSKKKGCRVDPHDYGAPGLLVLLALGGLAVRRRRDR